MRRNLAASAVAVLSVTLAGPALADHKPKHTPPERPVEAPPQSPPPAVTPPSGVETPLTPSGPQITSAYGLDRNSSGKYDATVGSYYRADLLYLTFTEPVHTPGGNFTGRVAVTDANGVQLASPGYWYASDYGSFPNQQPNVLISTPYEPYYPETGFSTGPAFPLTITGVSGVTDLDGNPVDLAGSDVIIEAQVPAP